MKINKFFLCAIFLFVMAFSFAPLVVGAQNGLFSDQVGLGKDTDNGDVGKPFGSPQEENRDVRVFVINIIKAFLSILGVLFVALIIWGGFRWMTSAGNQDQVSEAKKILMAGIIGFVIIMSTLVIANFISSTIEKEVLDIGA